MLILTDNSQASSRDALLSGLHRECTLDIPTHGH